MATDLRLSDYLTKNELKWVALRLNTVGKGELSQKVKEYLKLQEDDFEGAYLRELEKEDIEVKQIIGLSKKYNLIPPQEKEQKD